MKQLEELQPEKLREASYTKRLKMLHQAILNELKRMVDTFGTKGQNSYTSDSAIAITMCKKSYYVADAQISRVTKSYFLDKDGYQYDFFCLPMAELAEMVDDLKAQLTTNPIC